MINKILITGGAGSFGQAFTQVALTEHNPEEIRIYSRGEILQIEMEAKIKDSRLRFIIGDVRDKDRLKMAMRGVNLVVHAAALKMIPPGESNPIEFVKTNIGGATNIIDVAIENKVEKVFGISTDKACHPVNLYGATKMVMEKLFIQANEYSGTKFSCSRYGNVIDARGEVLQAFLSQRGRKKVTMTDERMIRYWLKVEQGVRFVIGWINKMRGGEIFVPKVPSMRLVDVAKVIVPTVEEWDIIGIRPGEKLSETMISVDEARRTREFDDHFVIQPELSFWKEDIGGKSLPDGFRYSSDNNSWWLTKRELEKMIGL